MEDKLKYGLGCFAALGIGAVGFVLTMVIIIVVIAALLGGVSSIEDDGVALEEKIPNKILVLGEESDDVRKVLRVRISGEISFEDDGGLLASLEEGDTASKALRHIRAAQRDEDISLILLELDTPGGGVTESDEIWHELLRFKQLREGREVVVLMGAMCCSGGYYIACAADFIMARPTTTTGSIGVIMSTLNAAELAKKVGVEGVTIATGENKALLDPLHPVSAEHVDVLRKVISSDYNRFVEIVSEGRQLEKESVLRLADGRVFSAEDALKHKLIDGIGYREDVYDLIEKRTQAPFCLYAYDDEVTLASCLGLRMVSSLIDRTARLTFKRLVAQPRFHREYR